MYFDAQWNFVSDVMQKLCLNNNTIIYYRTNILIVKMINIKM